MSGRSADQGERPATDKSDDGDLAGRPDIGLLRQLWRFREYGRRELRTLLLGLSMRIGELLSDLATPWPLALVIDHVIKGQSPTGVVGSVARLFGPSPVGMLAVAALAVLLITMSSGAFDYLGDRFMNSSGERITSAIRRDVFAHLQRLPMGFHDRQAVGELTSRVATDTSRIEDSLVDLFAVLIPGVLSLIGLGSVLLAVNWRLGLIALCAAPLLFATAARYTRLTRKAARRRRAAEGRLSGFIAESLRGIRTIHAFGRQDLHDRRFGATNNKVLQSGLQSVELRARFVPLLEVVAALGTAALLFVGGTGVINGWWTVGVLVVVTSYLKDMLKPMRNLASLALTFTRGAASAERIQTIFDQERPAETTDRELPDRVRGEIRLRGVCLDYGRGLVLDGLDLEINPRDRIALLGHNGAGKSTLLSLISGLYPPTKGAMLLDGLPLAELPDWWRHRQVAMVLQDTYLFSGTILDNIRYGRPDASDEEIQRVAKASLVTQFTDELDSGLYTELSDGGVGLSGGQRQRVGIARALLADAPVVLLDEPTTGLDVRAEELVVQALTPLMEGRTVVMTTHRPALVRVANRIVHLNRGRISRQEPGPAAAPWASAGAPLVGAPVNGSGPGRARVNRPLRHGPPAAAPGRPRSSAPAGAATVAAGRNGSGPVGVRPGGPARNGAGPHGHNGLHGAGLHGAGPDGRNGHNRAGHNGPGHNGPGQNGAGQNGAGQNGAGQHWAGQHGAGHGGGPRYRSIRRSLTLPVAPPAAPGGGGDPGGQRPAGRPSHRGPAPSGPGAAGRPSTGGPDAGSPWNVAEADVTTPHGTAVAGTPSDPADTVVHHDLLTHRAETGPTAPAGPAQNGAAVTDLAAEAAAAAAASGADAAPRPVVCDGGRSSGADAARRRIGHFGTGRTPEVWWTDGATSSGPADASTGAPG
ncbi:MAG TPA: ABC transporter ATP-binding protein [Pseudonocardia sp.]|jgi:ABC-type multidrug transport system fused ATPase/permease subunit